METEVLIARQLITELLDRMGMKAEIDVFPGEEGLQVEIKGDREGILIGKHGRTLDSLQIVISRMINRRSDKPVRVALDINDYQKRRANMLSQMALRFGEEVKKTGRVQTVGPFNARDRRIIHVALKEDASLRTESFGEGEMKKIAILPNERKESEGTPE